MARYRDFAPGMPLPSTWTDALEDLLYNYVSPNFRLDSPSSTTVRCPATTGTGKVEIMVNGKPRWRTTDATATHPGGAGGTHNIWAISGADTFTTDGLGHETDTTDHSFSLLVLTSGQPTGSGAQTNFCKVGEVDWDGTKITRVRNTVGDLRVPLTIGQMDSDVQLAMSEGKQEGVKASGDGFVTRLTSSSVRIAAGAAWVKGDGAYGFSAYYRVSWAQTDITGIPAAAVGQERVDTYTIPLPAGGAGTAVPVRRAGTSVATQASFDAAITASFPDANLPAGELRLANGWQGNAGLGSQANIRDRRTFSKGNDFEKVGGAGNPFSNTAAMTDVSNTGVWGTAPLAPLFMEVGESGLVEVTLNSNFTKGGTPADTAITEQVLGRIYIDDAAAGRNFYQDHHRAGRWQNHCSSEKFALTPGRHKFSFGLTGGAGFAATVWASADTRLRVAEVLSPGADAA